MVLILLYYFWSGRNSEVSESWSVINSEIILILSLSLNYDVVLNKILSQFRPAIWKC